MMIINELGMSRFTTNRIDNIKNVSFLLDIDDNGSQDICFMS